MYEIRAETSALINVGVSLRDGFDQLFVGTVHDQTIDRGFDYFWLFECIHIQKICASDQLYCSTLDMVTFGHTIGAIFQNESVHVRCHEHVLMIGEFRILLGIDGIVIAEFLLGVDPFRVDRGPTLFALAKRHSCTLANETSMALRHMMVLMPAFRLPGRCLVLDDYACPFVLGEISSRVARRHDNLTVFIPSLEPVPEYCRNEGRLE